MNIKNLKKLLILCLTIVRTLSFGQTASDNRICLTPDQYRFFDDAVIEKQRLAGENKVLNSAITALREAHVADSTAITKLESVVALNGEKEAIYTTSINLLQDDVDSANKKVVRNRKIAIAGFGFVSLEALIIAGFIYLR